MTLDLPKERWELFFHDLSKGRFGWATKIEVMSNAIGDQFLNENLPLNGITAEQKGDASIVSISVGEDAAHQTHNIVNPTKVTFLGYHKNLDGIVEIEEGNGTKTLVHIFEPVPLTISYAEYGLW